jgi:hypothetical protein
MPRMAPYSLRSCIRNSDAKSSSISLESQPYTSSFIKTGISSNARAALSRQRSLGGVTVSAEKDEKLFHIDTQKKTTNGATFRRMLCSPASGREYSKCKVIKDLKLTSCSFQSGLHVLYGTNQFMLDNLKDYAMFRQVCTTDLDTLEIC